MFLRAYLDVLRCTFSKFADTIATLVTANCRLTWLSAKKELISQNRYVVSLELGLESLTLMVEFNKKIKI